MSSYKKIDLGRQPNPSTTPGWKDCLEQNDPQQKGAGKIQKKLNKVRFESSAQEKTKAKCHKKMKKLTPQ